VCSREPLRTSRSRLRRQSATSGSAAIQFAIVAPAFLALVFGIIYLGMIYFDTQTLQTAVESAGRMISLNSSVTQDQLKTAIQNQLGVIGSPTITVSYTTATINGQNVGHLTATMTRTYIVPLITTYNMNYTAETYLPPNAFAGG
jgi:Flp pilus assembly protein TadG